MCRHIYNWNIVACDVKQPISLTHLQRSVHYHNVLPIDNVWCISLLLCGNVCHPALSDVAFSLSYDNDDLIDYNLFMLGSVGGSHFRHKGAAVNYLCLPKQPEWLSRSAPGDGRIHQCGLWHDRWRWHTLRCMSHDRQLCHDGPCTCELSWRMDEAVSRILGCWKCWPQCRYRIRVCWWECWGCSRKGINGCW